jgi:hypothetical protein
MKCFVIMPFGNTHTNAEHASRLESIYSKWIKPAVESIIVPGEQNQTISCHRGDKTFRPGEIITHVIENLISSEIVIADLSGRNANVFYELGVRHAVGNNCILISDNIEDVPFDLRPLRTIVYKYEPDSMLMLQDSLKQAVLEIIENFSSIDNPVRRYIYQKEVEKSLQKSSSPDSDLVKNIISEMSILRREFANQSNEVRKIMNLITSAPNNESANVESKINLQSLEGIWIDEESASRFYIRLVDGELSIPYSYGDFQVLTGHVNSYKIIDKSLFGRFEWFKSSVTGYIFIKFEGMDEAQGGWWYKEDVPEDLIKNLSNVHDGLPKMNKLLLKRISSATRFPWYIEEYFKSK